MVYRRRDRRSITTIEKSIRTCVHRAVLTYPFRGVVADSIQGLFPVCFFFLSAKCTHDHVITRHLSDPSHREKFKFARLVVLGIFAAHAQKLGEVVMLI